MPAPELSFFLLGGSIKSLTKLERQVLEADLLAYVCKELKEDFRERYAQYMQLINFNNEEDDMLDMDYIRLIIKDILLSGEYSLSGIAYYTQTPEEVVYEVAAGCNSRPSAFFLQQIITLHQEVKQDLYLAIRKKIAEQYLSAK